MREGRTFKQHLRTQASSRRTVKTSPLSSLDHLRDLFPAHLQDAATTSSAPETALEASDCRGAPDWLLDSFSENEHRSLDDHSALFDAQILPSTQALRTRRSYFANWRAFVTYALHHDCLEQVIPASPKVIKGYLWFLLQSGYRPGSITLKLYAIIDRHRRFKLPFPYHQREIKSWIKAFERLCGVPRRDKLAITATHLKAMLSSPDSRGSLRNLRDIAIVALGTICALRVSEITEIDVCDLLFEFEPGTLAVRIKKRKNDQKRAGLWPRIGRSTHPQYDVISLLQSCLRRANLELSPACEKQRHPRSACRTCGRLFSRLSACGKQTNPVGHRMHGTTSNTIRDAVNNCLRQAGFPADEFSGISMRRGGLTTALAGGVPSDLYELQSGHSSAAWKSYVRPGQTDQLLRFYHSFQL